MNIIIDFLTEAFKDFRGKWIFDEYSSYIKILDVQKNGLTICYVTLEKFLETQRQFYIVCEKSHMEWAEFINDYCYTENFDVIRDSKLINRLEHRKKFALENNDFYVILNEDADKVITDRIKK